MENNSGHLPLVILKNTQEENVYMIVLKYEGIIEEVLSIYEQLGTKYSVEDSNIKVTRAEYCFVIEQTGGIIISQFTLKELLKTIEVIIAFYNIKNASPNKTLQVHHHNFQHTMCKSIYIIWSSHLKGCYVEHGLIAVDICQYYYDFCIVDVFDDDKEVKKKLQEHFHLITIEKEDLIKKLYAFKVLYSKLLSP